MREMKKPIQKNHIKFFKKNKKSTSLLLVNKRRKRIFVQTLFSPSTLKLDQKNFTPQKHSLFRSTSRFGVTKITTTIWL